MSAAANLDSSRLAVPASKAVASSQPDLPITTDWFVDAWKRLTVADDIARREAANLFVQLERSVRGLGGVIETLARDLNARRDLEDEGADVVLYQPLTHSQLWNLMQAAQALHRSAEEQLEVARDRLCREQDEPARPSPDARA
jgi:hypothetical protein